MLDHEFGEETATLSKNGEGGHTVDIDISDESEVEGCAAV